MEKNYPVYTYPNCQDCALYNRSTKKCELTGKYTARKNWCDNFKERK